MGALVLEDRTEPADPAETATALAAAVTIGALPWTDAARQLQARVALMRGLEEGWPDLGDAALAAIGTGWRRICTGCPGWAMSPRINLTPSCAAGWTGSRGAGSTASCRGHLGLPGGRAAVDYTQPVPLAEARAQYFYGLASTPVLAGGRVGLRLALLSDQPGGRWAITADLPGFWRGAWADVRKDMRGRYPRHYWPDKPAIAAARPAGARPFAHE